MRIKKKQSISLKTIVISSLATLIEWFDFSIYIYIASYLSELFFPHDASLIGLMETFGIFAAGYLMRPLGGLFFGQLGDKIGRKKTLIYAVSCMSLSIFMMTILPTYQRENIISICLLVSSRMLQGFSVGGEHTGVLVMLIEQADQKYRGFYTSIATFISGNGVLLSSITVMCLTHYLDHEQMLHFGWRIPYLIGFLLTIIALFLQRFTEESPLYNLSKNQKKTSKNPLKLAIKQNPYAIFIVFCLAGYIGIAYYMGTAFFPSYLTTVLNITNKETMTITSIAAFTYAYSAPLWGWLSDKIGRKPLLLFATLGLAITSYPLFLLISTKTFAYMLWSEIIFMLLITAATPAFVTCISELFPTNQRYSGVSMGYNIGNAVFGATTPLVCTTLIQLTNNHLSPCFYLIMASIPMLIILIRMPETKNKDLQQIGS